MTWSPLKRFFVLALLWLPAMFFVWVYFSSLFAVPSTTMARSVLAGSYSSIFHDVYRGFPSHLVEGGSAPVLPGTPTDRGRVRDDHLLMLRFNDQAMPASMRAQKQATGEEPLPIINTMIYGYGLALIWGLVMATPLSTGRRWLQVGAGWLVIALVQTFGAITASLVTAMRHLGTEPIRAAGIHPELLAGLYQFGYLILPAVVPVVLWMLMNRSFIQTLTERFQEPTPPAPVQSAPDPKGPGASNPD